MGRNFTSLLSFLDIFFLLSQNDSLDNSFHFFFVCSFAACSRLRRRSQRGKWEEHRHPFPWEKSTEGRGGGGAGGNTIVTRDIENINQASSSSFFSFSAKGGEKVAAARDVALVSALPGAKFQIPASFLLASRRKEEQR